uniref:Cyclin N-terminal domain-containing protein n=1 Tax=Caenorhabditis tropicalis TaxID=1561998 RepID=A0A1I7UF17_9PELO
MSAQPHIEDKTPLKRGPDTAVAAGSNEAAIPTKKPTPATLDEKTTAEPCPPTNGTTGISSPPEKAPEQLETSESDDQQMIETHPNDDDELMKNNYVASRFISDTKAGWYRTAEQLLDTPSRRDGITSEQEKFLLIKGCHFMRHIFEQLMVEPKFAKKVGPTGSAMLLSHSVTYVHRFFCQFSLTKFDIFDVAASIIIFACESKNVRLPTDDVMKIVLAQKTPSIVPTEMTIEAQKQTTTRLHWKLSEALGQQLHVDSPHYYIIKWYQEKKTNEMGEIQLSKDIFAVAFFLVTEILLETTWCIQHPSTLTAAACILLSGKIHGVDHQYVFPSNMLNTWRAMFNGNTEEKSLAPLLDKVFDNPMFVIDNAKECSPASFATRYFNFVPTKTELHMERGSAGSREKTPKDQKDHLKRNRVLEICIPTEDSTTTDDPSPMIESIEKELEVGYMDMDIPGNERYGATMTGKEGSKGFQPKDRLFDVTLEKTTCVDCQWFSCTDKKWRKLLEEIESHLKAEHRVQKFSPTALRFVSPQYASYTAQQVVTTFKTTHPQVDVPKCSAMDIFRSLLENDTANGAEFHEGEGCTSSDIGQGPSTPRTAEPRDHEEH